MCRRGVGLFGQDVDAGEELPQAVDEDTERAGQRATRMTRGQSRDLRRADVTRRTEPGRLLLRVPAICCLSIQVGEGLASVWDGMGGYMICNWGLIEVW